MSPSPASGHEELLAGLDREREALNAMLGPVPSSRPAWEAVLSARDGADPPSRAMRARALNALGRPEDALATLGGDGLEPGIEAESRMMLGDYPAARAALDRAFGRAPGSEKERVLSAILHLATGDLAAAGSELSSFDEDAPLATAALAVRALARAQGGDERAAESMLTGAIGRTDKGWLRALRGTVRRGLGDLAGARADLDAAAAAEPSAWVLAERADVLNRSGFYRDALKDLEQAARLAPGSAAPHAQAANVYFDQAFYPEALESMDKALALAPADAGLIARRARFDTVLGELEKAESGYARARALAPDDEQVRFELLQVRAMLGRGAQTLKAVAKGEVREPFAGYLRAFVAFRAGKRRAARALFLKAMDHAGGAFAERLRLYAEVAAVLGDKPRKPKARPKGAPQFYLCGIGIKHPHQATVEILRALDGCSVIYNNLGDPQIADFLGLFQARVRAVDRRFGEPALGRVQRILAGVKSSGPPTGFVTRIHPFIYRRIANDLAHVCEERGIRYRAFGAVSLTEAAWGLGDERAPVPAAAAPFGARVFDLVWLVAHPEQLAPARATVVYCIASTEHRLKLCGLLSASFPPAHPAYVLAGSGDKEGEVRPLTVGALTEALPRFDMGAVLYVPALGGKT